MTAERVNPFADLSDFEVKPAARVARTVEAAQIDQIAQENGFPSRQAAKPVASPLSQPPAQIAPRAPRRHTTGRNQQINIKATVQTIDRLYRLADADKSPLGAVLERALDALERERTWAAQGSPRP